MDKPLSEDESKSNVNVSELIMEGDLADRKITRNQKRKHDEINHVQKVWQWFCFKLADLTLGTFF